MYRLVEQGTGLFVTGELTVEVRSPGIVRRFGERVAGGDLDGARSVLARAEATFDQCVSPLPDEPDEAPVEAWLQQVRAAHWAREAAS